MDRLPVSLCMIVRDAADDLRACLACVDGWFAHTVVVDTGSADDTVSVAAAAGADVRHFAWCDDFSAARNAGLSYATQPWILVLDADERLDAAAYAAIRSCIGGSADAYVVPYRSYTNHAGSGDWVPNDGSAPDGSWAGWVPGEVVRLFRNRRGFCFAGRVHETLDASLFAGGAGIDRAPFLIHHLQERHGLEYVAAKQRRYMAMLEQEIAEGRGTAKRHADVAIIRREFCDAPHDAIAGLRRALAVDPMYQPAWRELVATHLAVGDVEAARVAAQRMAARWPAEALPHYAVGMSAQQAGDLPAAEAAFRTALRAEPTHLNARVHLAEVLLRRGRIGEARPELEALHREYPAHLGVLRQLSAAYAFLGLGSTGAAALEPAATAVPTDAVLWNNLGVMRAQAGDRTAAAAAFRRVLAAQPDHADARKNLHALDLAQ